MAVAQVLVHSHCRCCLPCCLEPFAPPSPLNSASTPAPPSLRSNVPRLIHRSFSRRGIASWQVGRLLEAVWLPLKGTPLGNSITVPPAVADVDLCRMWLVAMAGEAPIHPQDLLHIRMSPAVRLGDSVLTGGKGVHHGGTRGRRGALVHSSPLHQP